MFIRLDTVLSRVSVVVCYLLADAFTSISLSFQFLTKRIKLNMKEASGDWLAGPCEDLIVPQTPPRPLRQFRIQLRMLQRVVSLFFSKSNPSWIRRWRTLQMLLLNAPNKKSWVKVFLCRENTWEQMRTLLKSRMASDKLSDLKVNQRGRGEKLAAIFLRKLACYLSHVKRSSFFWQNICTHQRLQCRKPIIGENTNVGKNIKVSKKIKVTIQIFFPKMAGWYFGEIKPCNKPLSIQSVWPDD